VALVERIADASPPEFLALEGFGISLDRITSKLLVAGARQFKDAADTLFKAIETKRRSVAT
jgi:hypothetical protein